MADKSPAPPPAPAPPRNSLAALARGLFTAPLPGVKPGRQQETPLLFTERGCALFVSLLVFERKEDAVLKLSLAELVEAACEWRRKWPQIWQIVRLGDTVRMARFSKLLFDAERTEREYRVALDRILAEVAQAVPVAPAKTAAA